MGKKIGIGIAAVLAILLVVGFLLPSKMIVKHTSEINAPAEVVFVQLNDMQKTLAWDPWAAKDSTMKVTLGKVTVGPGASKSWTSEESGSGSLTITESIPGKSVRFDLDFKEQGTAKGGFTLEETAKGTRLTQHFEGGNDNIIVKYMQVIFIKSLIKNAFIQGHENIKKLAEASK